MYDYLNGRFSSVTGCSDDGASLHRRRRSFFHSPRDVYLAIKVGWRENYLGCTWIKAAAEVTTYDGLPSSQTFATFSWPSLDTPIDELHTKVNSARASHIEVPYILFWQKNIRNSKYWPLHCRYGCCNTRSLREYIRYWCPTTLKCRVYFTECTLYTIIYYNIECIAYTP